MKTKITKETAVLIIENAIRHETLVARIEEIAGTGIQEFGSGFNVIEPLFNLDFNTMDVKRNNEYFDIFFNAVNDKGNDYAKKAEKVYRKTLALSMRTEPQTKASGVISLLKGQNYNIQGNFNLET
ncbi:hypothetical protein FGF1_03510 [Flavobacteriaceae bacterium GF1]